jgi:Zn-dependent peptidase ImmA (M78 family)
LDETNKEGLMQNIKYYIQNLNISKEALSLKTGLSLERINSLISGEIEITMSDIRKLSKVLKLSTDFLVSDIDKFEEINILFRKAGKIQGANQEADKVSYMIGNTFSLLGNAHSNQSLFSNFPQVENSSENARKFAAKFRQLFLNNDFHSPLLNLPKIVSDELNCILFVVDLGKEVDGASAIINSIPFIFISPRFEPRMLFTLAHELAHILSHHDKNQNFAKFDSNISVNKNQRFKDEYFANAFASELLLPEEGVGITLKALRSHFKNDGPLGDIEIIYLSRIYGVSFEVAAKRCEDLKLLPIGGSVSISEKIKSLYDSAEKRAEEINIPERPKIEFPKVSPKLIKLAIDKINSGEISLGKASEILSVSVSDLVKFNVQE